MKIPVAFTFLLSSLVCFRFGVAAEPAASPGESRESGSHSFAVIALTNPRSVAIDRLGNLYVGDADSGKVLKITPGGSVGPANALGASAIKDPIGLGCGPDGAVYVADADGDSVFRISSTGAVTALPKPGVEGGFSTPTSVAVDGQGNIFVANNGNNAVLKITPGGVASVFAGKPGSSGSADGVGAGARFGLPRGVAVDGEGDLYVADEGNSNIRKITPLGVVSTFAGMAGQSGTTDGDAATARFAAPRSLAADAAGTVYVADTDNHCIRKISPAGVVSTLAGRAGEAGKADGPGGAARFSEPRGIAVDAEGDVYVADTGNGEIREITPNGVVTTIAGPAPLPPAAVANVASVPVVPFVAAPAPLVPPRTGKTERIDYSRAQTLAGWDADPAYWSVKDGVFVAKGERVPSTFLLTQSKFSDFRLTLWSQVVESDNHAGVCLWGEQVASANGKNRWAYKGPLVIFPGLGLWDYNTNKNIPVDPAGKALAKKIAGQHDWIQVEILAQGNRIRVAYNGRQVLDWREPDPARLRAGPIGLQLHGFTKPQEVIYKDVVIEAFPQNDQLITLKE